MKLAQLCFAALVVCSIQVSAQTVEVHAKPLTEQDIKLMRQDLQESKNKIIANTMQFSTAENAVFWPIYNQYAGEQHAIAGERLRVITDYARHLDSLDNAKAGSITERMFQIEDATQELRRKYYPKFVQALGAKRAAKFYQVDNRLTMMMNVQLASEIPLIP